MITKLIQIRLLTHKHSVHMHVQPSFGNPYNFLTWWQSPTITPGRKCVFKQWKKQLNTKKFSLKQDRLQLFALIMCFSWEHKTYYRLQSHITVNFSDIRCFLSQEYLPHFTTILPPQQLKQATLLHWHLLVSFSPALFQALLLQRPTTRTSFPGCLFLRKDNFLHWQFPLSASSAATSRAAESCHTKNAFAENRK